jgi:dipeptidyl aminopeptidase/acylaminoacyl peptidase
MATCTQPLLDIDALTSTGSITGVDVSPDGSRAVFSSSESGRARLYIVHLDPVGEPVVVPTGSEAATQPHWSPRGDLIAFLRDVGGDENYSVCILAVDGGEVRDVSNCAGRLHENLAWSRDGTRIAFVSNRDGQFDVYYADVDTGRVHRVTDYPSVHHSPQFSNGGTRMSFGSNRSGERNNWDTFIISLADGMEKKITDHPGEADEMSYYAGQRPIWSPNDCEVLVGSSVSGTYNTVAIDVPSMKREPLISVDRDASNAQWSPDGKRVAYVLTNGADLQLRVRDRLSGDDRLISQPRGSSGTIGMRGKGPDYRWLPDGMRIVYGHSAGDEPGSVWIADVETGDRRLLYSSLPESINRGFLTAPRNVEYTSFDGRTIYALLYMPGGRDTCASAIVMPHGGPTGQSTNSWSSLVQYLVSLGFAVLQPNFRGSTGYGREFQWLNRNDWGGGDLQDVVYGGTLMRERFEAKSVGIMGGSYGGYMALSAITQAPEHWDAAVSIYGIVNLVTMYQTAREDMRLFQERNIGTPSEDPEFYHSRSPLNNIQNIQCPLLVLQGERDARVTVQEATQIIDSLREADKPFEFVIYPDEGHGFAKLSTRRDYTKRIGDFFLKYMPSQQPG